MGVVRSEREEKGRREMGIVWSGREGKKERDKSGKKRGN